jgi:hypothetical protein
LFCFICLFLMDNIIFFFSWIKALGNVISALAENSKGKNVFVPYRDRFD